MADFLPAVLGLILLVLVAAGISTVMRRRGESEDDLVTVGRYQSPDEAHMGRLRLEEHEIEALVADEHGTASVPSLGGGAKLQVRARDRLRAEEILGS
jgi:uncharacterized membrane protein